MSEPFQNSVRSGNSPFLTARWTVVLRAGGESADAEAALGQRCRDYWYPLYAFARRRGLAAMLAMSVVDQRAFPVLAGPSVVPAVKLITAPRLAPDGSWFAAAGEDKTVRVRDSATGRERARIALAIATQDAQLRFFAKIESDPIALPRTGAQPLDDVQFSADGARLIARSKDRVEVWKCDAIGAPISYTLDDELLGCALSADGARALTWTEKRAAVFDTISGKALREMTAQSDFIQGALAAEGKRVALIDGKHFARVWDIDSAALSPLIDGLLYKFRTLALNASGTRLTASGPANEVFVFDTASGLKISPPMRHFYQVNSLAISADGSHVVSCGLDGRAQMWDAETGELQMSVVWLNTFFAVAVDVSRDGGVVLLFSEKPREGPAAISLWRGTKTQPSKRQHVKDDRFMTSNRMSPDGRLGCLSISIAEHFRAYIYELATGRVVLDAPANGDVYTHLFSPDMRSCYAVTQDGWLHGFSLETGQPLWPPTQQDAMTRPSAISPDDAHHRRLRQRSHLHPRHRHRRSRADAGSGQRIENGALRSRWQRALRLRVSGWCGSHVDVHTGKKLSSLRGRTHTIIATSWSPDSRSIATASFDETARVRDAATGQSPGQPMPHLAWLAHLEFSPDGRLLATGCRDATVRFWHPLTGQPASPSLEQPSTPRTVHFTADGRCLFVRDHMGFSFWDTEKFEPVTMHYPEPLGVGTGIDSAAFRANLSPDGTLVHLGAAMAEGALWTISQPRTAVPDWFPDFLESLALIRLDATGTPRVSTGERIFKLKELLGKAGNDEPYAAWARRVLGMDLAK